MHYIILLQYIIIVAKGCIQLTHRVERPARRCWTLPPGHQQIHPAARHVWRRASSWLEYECRPIAGFRESTGGAAQTRSLFEGGLTLPQGRVSALDGIIKRIIEMSTARTHSIPL